PRGYYSTDDWTDRAIQYIKELRASSTQKPFFLYLAHNAVHAPLQSKPQDLEKYRGRYDAGWTEVRAARFQRQLDLGLIPEGTRLAGSDARVPLWNDTDPADRPLFARHMETYAAMLDCVDQNLGRLLHFLDTLCELDNTIVVFSSDNGGTDAGGPTGMFNNNRRYMALQPEPMDVERARLEQLGGPQSVSLYPTAWGEVCNTPFPSFKTYTGGGGRRVSFVVSWPRALQDHGAIRRQFMHVTDVMPTLLDLAGVSPLGTVNGETASTMHGLSFADVLRDGEAESPRNEQYYECWANRAYYRDGWLARSIQRRGQPIDLDNWTLHHLAEDFSESTDLAAHNPDKLHELVEAFDKAAWENFVYPLDNRDRFQKFADVPAHARAAADVPRTFHPGTQTVHRADIFPLISDRSFAITVRFTQSRGDAGVLWAVGDPIGGMVMYIENEQLHFHYNGFGAAVSLPTFAVPPGEHSVRLDYQALGKREGRGRILLAADERVGWTALSPTLTFGVFEGRDVGFDRRGPVLWELYERHGAFGYSGNIHAVHVEPGTRAAD
ncbi:MAG: sulfatase-like hydrolase/transferase, partial [Gammaproteobacteria bacterium]|nr:sulfatase-like hydrolase/transferase [Gammaproteobacteria bacterium]